MNMNTIVYFVPMTPGCHSINHFLNEYRGIGPYNIKPNIRPLPFSIMALVKPSVSIMASPLATLKYFALFTKIL